MSTLTTTSAIHMNCSWSISHFPQHHLSRENSASLVKQAFQLVEEFENYFTIFKSSPFNDLNEYAGIRPVQLSKEAIQLVKLSIDYYNKTGGFFNICFQSDTPSSPNSIVINEELSTVFLPNSNMKISLGGIGKGYAVDLCFNFLKTNGLINFMVNGSGDLRVHSHPDAPRGWKVGITNPFNIKNNIGILNIRNGSTATSGQYLKKGHIRSSHKNTPLAVTVQTENTAEADVYATYLASLKIDHARKKMDEMKICGFIIENSGTIHRSTSSFKGNY